MRHDKNKEMFIAGNTIVTYGDIVNALIECDADKCDILFVHSDVSFGIPQKGIKRKELKELLVDALLDTGVSTVMFPTFTFSFCNKEDYDIENSPTAMGMIPDYVRTRSDSIRTDDPIMSVAIIGNSEGFEQMDGNSSCGVGGIFHQIHNSGKTTKFLFFGTSVTKCFTYLHYVEEIMGVPYRYAKPFSGKIIDHGVERDSTVNVFVRYKDVLPTLPENFEDELINRGIEKKVGVGNSWISAVDESTAYDYICSLISENTYVFSIMPESNQLVKEYIYGNVTTM